MRAWMRTAAVLAAGLTGALSASAAVFPDVPDGHIYQDPIERLVEAGVINGNPDGNFSPDRSVNRAEMLKMLYLAGGLIPERTNRNCFPDVEAGGWYESFVCDAAARHFVAGYGDGTFKPAQEVNRVEALKMIQEVLGIPIGEISEIDRSVVNFIDVSTSAWYTKYLFNAYDVGILPIAGQDESHFYPDWSLRRGEAAAMIANAQDAVIRLQRGDQTAEEEDVVEENASSSVAQEENTEESSSGPAVVSVVFPLDERGKFEGKDPYSYRFTLDSRETISVRAEPQAGQPGSVSCVLFRMEESGMSYEYYVGVKDGQACTMLVALKAGAYQLQLQPSQADTTFEVEAETSTGDGNDGFVEADVLKLNAPTTAVLAPANTANWYTFTVADDAGARRQVELSNSTNVLCMMYPMGDVDIYGFGLPQCNQYYEYPKGTYVIGVMRNAPASSRQSYTIILRE